MAPVFSASIVVTVFKSGGFPWNGSATRFRSFGMWQERLGLLALCEFTNAAEVFPPLGFRHAGV